MRHSLSFFDKRGFLSMLRAVLGAKTYESDTVPFTLETFYDWFYADKLRCFFVRPELYLVPPQGPGIQIHSVHASLKPPTRLYYEDILGLIQELNTLVAQKNWSEYLQLFFTYIEADYKYALHFFTFFHPLVCLFAKALYEKDVEGLMARETQFADRGLDFNGLYEPTALVDPDYPREIVDFDPKASYSIYNWELFYFAPMYVAEQVSTVSRF